MSFKFNMDINAFPRNELHRVDSVNQVQVWVLAFFLSDGILGLQSQMAILGFQIP